MTGAPRSRAGAVLLIVVLGTTVLSTASWRGADLCSRANAAAGRPIVVLFTPSYPEPLIARLEAELAAVGIGVRRAAAPPEAQLDAAIARELGAGASAAIRVIPRSRGTEVWAGDTTARVLRARSIRADSSDAALSVIALRTAEFLRASLLDLRQRATPAAPAGGRSEAQSERSLPDQAPLHDVATADRTTGKERSGTHAPAPEPFPPAPLPPAPSRPLPSVPARVPAEPAPAPGVESTAGRSLQSPRSPPGEQIASSASGQPVPGDLPGARKVASNAPETVETVPSRPRPPTGLAEPGRFEITAGPAVLASPGGISPTLSAAALARARITNGAGIELIAIFPLGPARLTFPEGRVQVRTALFGAAATMAIPLGGRWMGDAALGASAIMFRSTGSAAPATPNAGTVESVFKLAGHVRAGIGIALSSWLALRTDVVAGLCTGRIVSAYLATDGNRDPVVSDRASFGPAFAAGVLGVHARW